MPTYTPQLSELRVPPATHIGKCPSCKYALRVKSDGLAVCHNGHKYDVALIVRLKVVK